MSVPYIVKLSTIHLCRMCLYSTTVYSKIVPYVSVFYSVCTLHLYFMCLYSTVILLCTVCVCTLPCAVHMYRMCLYCAVYSTVQYSLYSTLYSTRVQYYLYLHHMSVLYCVQYTCTVCVCTAYSPLA